MKLSSTDINADHGKSYPQCADRIWNKQQGDDDHANHSQGVVLNRRWENDVQLEFQLMVSYSMLQSFILLRAFEYSMKKRNIEFSKFE